MWLTALLILLVAAMVAAYKKRISSVQNFNQGISIFDDFLEPNVNVTSGSYAGQYFNSSVSGNGLVQKGSGTAYPGSVLMHIDTTNDKAGIKFTSSLVTSNSSLLATETRAKVDALTNGSNSAEMYFGFVLFSAAAIASTTYAAAFVYDSSISANWIAQVNIASTPTKVITSIPVVAGTDVYLKVIIVPNLIYFLINNVVVSTMQLTMPTTIPLLPTWFLTKGTGTQTLEVTTDGIGVYQQFTTPRIFSNTFLTQ